MKKIIWLFIMTVMFTNNSYTNEKDSLDILKVQNAALLRYINEVQPVDDGYTEIAISPIEKRSLEVGTDEIRAFGSGVSVKETLARNIAFANASANIQKKLEQYIRYGLEQYTSTLSAEDVDNIDEKTQEQLVIACKNILEGVIILDTKRYYNMSSRRYKYEMCVKYDREKVIAVLSEQDERILHNEKKFQEDMQKAWDELDEAHKNKLKVTQNLQNVTVSEPEIISDSISDNPNIHTDNN